MTVLTSFGVPTRHWQLVESEHHSYPFQQLLYAALWRSNSSDERMDSQEELSLLDKIDAVAPTPLKSFDAFPKLPSTYRTRSSERGFLTLFISLIAFLLVANDIGEFIWGWPDFEFGVDHTPTSFMDVNVDLIVNMPCRCANAILSFPPSERGTDRFVLDLTVDLLDAVGDRLYLSKGFHRDGVSALLTCRESALPWRRPCLTLDKLPRSSEFFVPPSPLRSRLAFLIYPVLLIENTRRASLRGKLLPSPASRAVFSRASSVAPKTCTNLPIIMYQTAAHAAYMVRSPSKELQVGPPFSCSVPVIHTPTSQPSHYYPRPWLQ